jgi:tripartite-type tricarboxylate transporter receptor subunit TctC
LKHALRRHTWRRLRTLSLAILLLFAAAAPATAEEWPTRIVYFLLTLGPGSGIDISGRLLADRLTRKWGQPVVVENKPGGDGMVALSAFASARDDHVLLLTPPSSFLAHPYLHDNLPYKPSDLVPIARISTTLVGVSVPAESRPILSTN